MVPGVFQTRQNLMHLRFTRASIAWCVILAWHYHWLLGSLNGCIVIFLFCMVRGPDIAQCW